MLLDTPPPCLSVPDARAVALLPPLHLAAQVLSVRGALAQPRVLDKTWVSNVQVSESWREKLHGFRYSGVRVIGASLSTLAEGNNLVPFWWEHALSKVGAVCSHNNKPCLRFVLCLVLHTLPCSGF
jgi:hypothetical protein